MAKTARELLTEQLTVLDDQMTQVVANVARGDAEALVANGQFLESSSGSESSQANPAWPTGVIDLPVSQLRDLDALCASLGISRAEAVRPLCKRSSQPRRR